ncbi:hypothetical protein B0H17DRAFT_1211259 [Mycena rosella]|uniref:Uncharacterized protein n=1 Tax=Mycena rosella TaxID=1033263 RepID=A0AAD7CV72_MYCRO|nr:hypothetical protein B0H17DRAFT_1211259 [Mycena rosella]
MVDGLMERKSGAVQEFKQDKALICSLSSFVLNANRIPLDNITGGSAIFSELDLHRESFVKDEDSKGVSCRYGAVFSGRNVVLVESVLVDGVRALRTTDVLRCAGGQASVSYIALLIGMLVPPDTIPYPIRNENTQHWRDLRKEISTAVPATVGGRSGERGGGNEGDGAGNEGAGRRIGGTKRKREEEGEGGAGSSARGVLSGIVEALGDAVKADSFVTLKYPGLADESHCSLLAVDHAWALASKLQSPDTMLVDRRPPANRSTFTMELVQNLTSQNTGAVWRGIVRAAAGAQIVIKRFQATRFDELATELAAHMRLEKLGHMVAPCRAVVASPNLEWMAMVMDDAGPTVEASGGWTELTGHER